MDKLSCKEVSKIILNISVRRLQQMCKNGEIGGAEKNGKNWMIPKTYLNSFRNVCSKKPLPIGISDYKDAVKKYYYVDKTLLIKDVLDSMTKVSLFTRPRRFGKTLNMDMLRVFFESSTNDNSIYFNDKMIWSLGPNYQQYQGKYPVIFLSFKDVKCANWHDTLELFKRLISLECQRHLYLKDSDKLNNYEKEAFNKLLDGSADLLDYQISLQFLSMLLYKHYNKECIVLIDEYDTPIQQGHNNGFYNDVINFMRNFFSGGLKDNSYLAFGFLTGILRVAKESIFSGLNNIKIYSILDDKYSQYFGFTKDEVKEMLKYYDVSNKYNEVCEWYDGYRFGNTEIFNPWSVLNYIEDKCFPKAFWQSTGSNDIIGEIMSNATYDTTRLLYKLLTGDIVTTYIDTNIVYADLDYNPYTIFSFLLLTGYLKVKKEYPQNDGSFMCDVCLPNKEIAFIYEKEILRKTGKESVGVAVQQAIFNNNIDLLQQYLQQYLIESISIFDGTNESFYHGMMLGLCSLLSNRYQIKSNMESGFGRFDIELTPTNKNNPGFIFELKYVKDDAALKVVAQSALEQIENKRYDTNLKNNGIEKIVKVGIAFCGKKAEIITK